MPDPKDLDLEQVTDLAVRYGTNLLWAILILVVGLTLANWARRGTVAGLTRVRRVDETLRGFFASLVRYLILVFTGIAVLERLGVETTSLVAVVGAAGLAIGLALQGVLSNLAAGVLLLLFRPFRVGDGIEVGAIVGTVREITLFHTVLTTGENVQLTAPNSLLWNAALRNYSVHASRRVEVTVPVPYAEGVDAALAALKRLAEADPRIARDPAPAVRVGRLGDASAEVGVAVWCPTAEADAVRSDLAAASWRTFRKGEAG